MKRLIPVLLVAALCGLGTTRPTSAAPVTHIGEVLNGQAGAGLYSWIHTPANLSGSGTRTHGFDFGQTISYEWEPTSGADPLNGAEARFGSAGGATGQSPVVFDLPAFGSTGFDAQLTLGIAGAGTNILTFGAPKPASHHRVVNVPGGTATVTNRLSDTAANQINFQLDALDSGGAITESLIGFFEWQDMSSSRHPFNGIGNFTGSASVAVFLWGLPSDLSDACQTTSCDTLLSLTKVHTIEGQDQRLLGIDLAFTGSVPEPGALVLFAGGLLSLFGFRLARHARVRAHT